MADWTIPEVLSLSFCDGEFLYIVAWNAGFQQGLLFSATFANGAVWNSGPNSVLAVVGPSMPPGYGSYPYNGGAPANADLYSYFERPNWMRIHQWSPNNGVGWTAIAAIPSAAHWIWLDGMI